MCCGRIFVDVDSFVGIRGWYLRRVRFYGYRVFGDVAVVFSASFFFFVVGIVVFWFSLDFYYVFFVRKFYEFKIR